MAMKAKKTAQTTPSRRDEVVTGGKLLEDLTAALADRTIHDRVRRRVREDGDPDRQGLPRELRPRAAGAAG